MTRLETLNALTDSILTIPLPHPPHPLRVAIDGVDCAGKTTLADELAELLIPSKRQIIRSSIDNFHNPRAVRYSKGKESPEGYFLDSFNNSAVIENLLKPHGPGGSRQYKTAAFDYRTDSEAESPLETAEIDAILIFDGIFLQREELKRYWDLKIFIDISFEEVIRRAVKRDSGEMEDIIDIYNKRYIPGQKIYLERCQPKESADIVIYPD